MSCGFPKKYTQDALLSGSLTIFRTIFSDDYFVDCVYSNVLEQKSSPSKLSSIFYLILHEIQVMLLDPYHDFPLHGNLLDFNARWMLIDYFNEIARNIANKLTLDHTRDERGLTDDLIEELVRLDQSWLPQPLHRDGWRFEIRITKVPPKLESEVGADLGVITTISTNLIYLEKALLFQCKRLHPNAQSRFTPESRYGDLMEQHGLKQAKDMLAHTYASFFLLFNPRTYYVEDKFELMNEPVIETWEDAQYCGFQDILVLPATTRVGARTSDGDDSLPHGFIQRRDTINGLFQHTTNFSQFLVQDVFQCNVGDPSASALATARDKNREFHVRITVEMDLFFED